MPDQGILHSISKPKKEDIPQNLHEIKRQIASYQKNIGRFYLYLGHLLIKAKKQFGKHGEWISWLKENVDLSICKVQRLMKVAAWIDANEALVPHLKLRELEWTKLYILTRLSGDELEEFADFCEKDIHNMTKQQLETVIQDYLKSKCDKLPDDQAAPQTKVADSAGGDLQNRLNRIKKEVSKFMELIGKNPDEDHPLANELCEFFQEMAQQCLTDDLKNT